MAKSKKPARSKKDGPDHKKELQELLGFMSMAMELSTHFINLPPAEVDKNITHFLQCLVEFLHIERSSFIQIPEDKDIMMPVYAWAKKGYEPEKDVWRKEAFPYLFKKILRGEIFSAERLPDELPEEAHVERQFCIESGVKSNLTIPLKVGGEVTCAIFFGAYRAPRSWPAPLVHQLTCVGDILANAIARTQYYIYDCI